MNKKSKLTLAILLAFSLSYLKTQSQTSLNAGGGISENTSGKISYSIGGVFYESYSGETASLTPGVHHPYEIQVVSVNRELAPDIEIDLYPNPVINLLEISIKGAENPAFKALLYNTSGNLIHTYEIEKTLEQIDFESFIQGSYIMQIKEKNQIIKTFKIIKK